MTYHRYSIGAIEDVGVAPYQVSGDPVMALIAQLNRFAGRTVNPGGTCGGRNYLPHGALPMTTVLDDRAATVANLIVYDRLNCISDQRLMDFRKMATVREGLTNAVTWANANLHDITIQIAQFGDSLGLPAAPVGITTRDPNVTPKFPTTMILVGALALGAVFFVSRRKR